MKAVTAQEMQQIDRYAIDDLGLPGSVLMAIAGKSIADYIITHEDASQIIIFVGSGNNGGDGLVAAYYCHNHGLSVQIYLTAPQEKLTEDSALYYNLCKNADIDIVHIKNEGDVNLPHGDALIIDALFGTGFEGSLRSFYPQLIEIINSSGLPVVSADIPSGLPSDGQGPQNICVKADVTITMGLPKISLKTFPGIQFCGEVIVSDLGFPQKYIDDLNLTVNIVDKVFIKKSFNEEIDPYSYKGSNGHLVIIGGSPSMEGAALLGALGALETGIGLLTICTFKESRDIIAGKIPEAMSFAYDASSRGDDIENMLGEKKVSSVVFGPGIGREPIALDILNKLFGLLSENVFKTLLIDGDGLYALKLYLEDNDIPASLKNRIALTPHFGEASYLFNKTVDELKNNHLLAAQELSEKINAIVLLKGPSTITTDKAKSYINTTGNASMAVGGSGDVLSGICGALLARGYSEMDALVYGAYIHGRAGDLAQERLKKNLLRAGDIVDSIAEVLLELQ